MSDKITIEVSDLSKVSDGYHTIDELYEHRCLLFIAWMVSDGCPGNCYVLEDHYDGWDLIVCEMESLRKECRQISYHVKKELRPYYKTLKREWALRHNYDGHTSQDVLKRIKAWLLNP